MNAPAWKTALFRILTAAGALMALIILTLFALGQTSIPGSSWRDLFPFPGLYFLEIAGFCVVSALLAWRSPEPALAWRAFLPWVTSGILLAFVILGAWTIGFYLIPSFLAFLAASFVDPALQRAQLSNRVWSFIAATLLQSLLILAFVLIQ